jgi:hypothetical protein
MNDIFVGPSMHEDPAGHAMIFRWPNPFPVRR